MYACNHDRYGGFFFLSSEIANAVLLIWLDSIRFDSIPTPAMSVDKRTKLLLIGYIAGVNGSSFTIIELDV